MTDNEIIKGLECCPKCWDVEELERTVCQKCPYYNVSCCNRELYVDALSLINRQKAEIEELTKNLKFVRGTVERQLREIEILSTNADTAFQDGLNEAQDLYAEQVKNEIKAEAIKEFAERLKKCEGRRGVPIATIDNLVKEMVGDDNENL